MFTKLKDPFSGLSHLFGALMSIPAIILLVNNEAHYGNFTYIISFIVFGISMFLLYSASATYHLLKVKESISEALRTFDHMAIYMLIAGTYTPVCLIVLQGAWRWSLLIGIWTLALTGIILKLFWMNAPRWLSTMFYILMGWLVLIAFYPIVKTMTAAGVLWMVAGGVLYSIGGIIYATKWCPVHTKAFDFHELFHLFVLAGSFAHFWMMFRYF